MAATLKMSKQTTNPTTLFSSGQKLNLPQLQVCFLNGLSAHWSLCTYFLFSYQFYRTKSFLQNNVNISWFIWYDYSAGLICCKTLFQFWENFWSKPIHHLRSHSETWLLVLLDKPEFFNLSLISSRNMKSSPVQASSLSFFFLFILLHHTRSF